MFAVVVAFFVVMPQLQCLRRGLMNNTVKKTLIYALLALLLIILVAVVAFLCVYRTRLKTMSTIEKLSNYEDYNLYHMDVKYDYSLQEILDNGIVDNQSFTNSILKEVLPLLPIHMEAKSFGCTAFTMETTGGKTLMGHNYDFKLDTSSILVCCEPKDGYKSMAFASLDNLGIKDATKGFSTKMVCLAAPFACLDGINEKGVSIAILTLDSEPTNQVGMDDSKQTIGTSLVVRLVLDYAATTQEAVDLIAKYNMFATAGRDYHFYITDASGDGRVVEFDCDSPTRQMTVTPTPVVTNFFIMYGDKVLPNQKNEQYGHGKERYDSVLDVMAKNKGHETVDTAWAALVASSRESNPEDVTSNTQWSIVYNNTDLTATISLRRNWEDKFLVMF